MQVPSTRRGNILLERRIVPQSDRLLGLVQTFRGTDTRTAVTHNAFVMARIKVLEGNLSLPLSSGIVKAPRSFLLVLPPHSVLPMTFAAAHVWSEGIACFSDSLAEASRHDSSLTRGLLTEDTALLSDRQDGLPGNRLAMARMLTSGVWERLDADAGVAQPIVQARRLLHNLIAHPAPLRTAANSVGICAETISRGFSGAYKLSPKQYCHRARLHEAVLRLIAGATIIDAAFDAGFGDLKRFYKQFKRLVGVTPGTYTHIKKRQD